MICDGVLCVTCRDTSRVGVMSAAMMSGVCVPSAAVAVVFSNALPGVAWKIGGDSRNPRMTSQVTVKIQRITQDCS